MANIQRVGILYFTASACADCSKSLSEIKALATMYSGRVTVKEVSHDDDPDLLDTFGIENIPAVVMVNLDNNEILHVIDPADTVGEGTIRDILSRWGIDWDASIDTVIHFSKKKPNWLLIAGAVFGLIVLVFLLVKYAKK